MGHFESFDLTKRWQSKAFSLMSTLALGILLLGATLLPSGPALSAGAERSVTVTTVTIEYYDYADETVFTQSYTTGYGAPLSSALAIYGPFHVVAEDRVEMLGQADSYSPAEFRQLLADWPNIRALHFIDCGGTVDDNANLELARLIRSAGITTHVPARGSVRSGGVELFLAGVKRTAEPGAEFIVHSWRDNFGREAADYAASDQIHAPYLDYYREVGMAPESAQAFYALTNSVPHDSMRRLSLAELGAFGLLH